MDEPIFQSFVKLVHRLTGITILSNRKAMLQGRIQKRMRVLQLEDYERYFAYLGDHSEEAQHFVDAVTTNETYFYRTPRIWENLENDFLPRWFQANPKKVFRVWSAAASMGAEAYTLGMILQLFKEKHAGFDYQIYATDISETILTVAKAAVYSGRTIQLLEEKRPDLFHKYFLKKETGEHAVIPEIRARVSFQLHNLLEKPKSKEKFDLVLLRNVLIYFAASEQEKILSRVSESMQPNSLLVIGESESLNHLQTTFIYQIPLIYERGAA